MKNIVILFFAFYLGNSFFAQDCTIPTILKEGSSFTYSQYDKKGKLTSEGTHITKQVSDRGGIVNAEVLFTMKDLKSKDTFESNYNVSCEQGVLNMDMERFFDNSKLLPYCDDSFNVTIEGDVLDFPVQMSEKSSLKNGNITVKVKTDGLLLVTMDMEISDRKILDDQEVTTTAGTFNCHKLSYTFNSKIGFINISGSGMEYYTDEFVMVKSESFSKKGKLLGYSELTAISK